MRVRRLASGVLVAGMIGLTGCSTVSGWFSGEHKKKESLLSGERISVLAQEETLTINPDLKDAPVNLPSAVSPPLWSQAGGATTHDVPNIAATLATEQDSVSVGDGAAWPGRLMAMPVIDEKAVYAMDGTGVISAHARVHVSTTLWVSEAVMMDEPGFGGGLAVQGGTLYAVTPEGHVVALDSATGKTRWTRELRSPVRAAPRLYEDMLIVPTVDSKVYALNLASGTVRWQHRGITEAASMLGSSVPAADGPVIVVAYNSGELYALSRRNGEPVWNESLLMPLRTRASDSFTGISGDPVMAGGLVFSISTNGLLAALDQRTGLRVWEQRFASSQTPWAAGDFLFVLGSDERLVAFAAGSGQVKWITRLRKNSEKIDKDETLPPLHGPYMINGQLLVIDPTGRLILVDPNDGKIIDRRDFIEDVTVAPAYADGGIYVLNQASELHYIK